MGISYNAVLSENVRRGSIVLIIDLSVQYWLEILFILFFILFLFILIIIYFTSIDNTVLTDTGVSRRALYKNECKSARVKT